jgi:WD40 repeat protein
MTGDHAQSNYLHPQADIPGYIRVKSHDSRNGRFRNLFLAQELVGGKQSNHGSARSAPQTAIGSKISSGGDATIWAADFSLSGRYLAVAGKDRSIKLFKVITTEEERIGQQIYDSQRLPASKRFSAPVFLSRPCREFKGHSAEILTLSWSKNDFLLSGSTDKTVRLWHPSQPTCLRVFQHDKTVTSVAFHPTDDRFFLSGSFDATLRLWDIPRMSVVHLSPMEDIVTAVAFTPDGKFAICGSFNGICIFLDTIGLTERNRICIRSSDSSSNVCFKITGLQTVTLSNSIDTHGQAKLMITTNDSRIRIYHLAGTGLETKLEGIRNQSSQIRARFNDDGDYTICGSEDDEVHIWHLSSGERKEPHESFHTHSEVVTNAIMAPMHTREIVSLSKDPVYGLCNPRASGLDDLYNPRDHPGHISCSSQVCFDSPPKTRFENALENDSGKHPKGHIIVTTDTMGKVKVYRQDCAFYKRNHVSHSYRV